MLVSLADLVPPLVSRVHKYLTREFFSDGSTGLNKLDLKMIEAIGPGLNGYFVELGANDGIRQSNTYKLQKCFGWTGLLIEPSPARFIECVSNRAFGNRPEVRCAACVPFDYKDTFVEIEYADLMSVARGLGLSDQQVADHADQGLPYLADPALRHSFGAIARTLTSLLDEVSAPSFFDLLIIDVEGNELAVLRGLDLDRYRPSWILAEARGPEIAEYLGYYGYEMYSRLLDCADYSDILFCRLREAFGR
jgi:FkbM family methyltransferase